MSSFSNSCVYGLRASIFLASVKENRYVTIRELSDDLDISFYFLTKVLQKLTSSKILESYKGPNGGVKLARPADAILIKDIIVCLNGSFSLPYCVMGLPNCSSTVLCPMQGKWLQLRSEITDMVETLTLQELATKKI